MCCPPDFYLPIHDNIVLLYTPLDMAQNILSDWL